MTEDIDSEHLRQSTDGKCIQYHFGRICNYNVFESWHQIEQHKQGVNQHNMHCKQKGNRIENMAHTVRLRDHR